MLRRARGKNRTMEKSSKIYIAGHTGLVGSALLRHLKAEGYTNLITCPYDELDLTRQANVEAFFRTKQPEYVFLAAAKVGGILANTTYKAEFIYDNLMIAANVIQSAYQYGVKKLLNLGSSCIYPKLAPQPIREEYLLTGNLEPTNKPYAIAKIAGIELCEAFNRQHDTHFLSVMPTNLYGPNDNYDLDNSHVLPALIRRFHLAKLASKGDWEGIEKDEARYGRIPDDIRTRLVSISKSFGHAPLVPSAYSIVPTEVLPQMVLWGTGSPRREFLYSDDLADACIFLMNRIEDLFRTHTLFPEAHRLINIGCGQDQTIRELAEMVAKVVGFDGQVEWDTAKPDGTPQKPLDVSRLTDLGWRPKIPLQQGIHLAYQDYLSKTHR